VKVDSRARPAQAAAALESQQFRWTRRNAAALAVLCLAALLDTIDTMLPAPSPARVSAAPSRRSSRSRPISGVTPAPTRIPPSLGHRYLKRAMLIAS
jgi:hypothetical protein